MLKFFFKIKLCYCQCGVELFISISFTTHQRKQFPSCELLQTHGHRCFKLFLQTYRLVHADRNTHGEHDPTGFPLTLHIERNDKPDGRGMTWPIASTAARCLLALSEWCPWKAEWRRIISATIVNALMWPWGAGEGGLRCQNGCGPTMAISSGASIFQNQTPLQ